MTKSGYFLCIIILAGCNNNKFNTASTKADTIIKHKVDIKPKQFKPFNLNNKYTVCDTGEYTNGPMGGIYAVVKRDGVLADTIDFGYGIKELGNGIYLYQTLKSETGEEDQAKNEPRTLDFAHYTLIINNKKTPLVNIIEDFNDYFSSPNIINSKIYFWQIKTADTTGKKSISAAEFDPVTKIITSHYIKDDYMETDDSGYFPEPYIKNDTIYFDAGKDALMKYSKDFKPCK